MKIRARLFLAGFSVIVISLSACSNSYRFNQLFGNNTEDTSGNNGSTSEIDKDELEIIQAKYDNLPWEYNGAPVTITLAHWNDNGEATEKAVINALLAGFYNRYPNIKVSATYLQDYENTYGNNLQAGKVSDVFLVPDGAFTSWASSNKLTNLQPFIESSNILDLTNVFPTALTRYRFNPERKRAGEGVQLALPKDIGPLVMYYNKNLFAKYGVDLPPNDRIMTIDEANTMWQQLTQYENDKVVCYGVGGLTIEGLVWSAGGDFLDESRNHFPTDPTTLAGLKKGYQYMQDSYVNYKIQPPSSWAAGNKPSTLFTAQRVATLISGRSDVASFRSGLAFEWDVTYVPAFEENPLKNTYSGSVGYAIYSGVENAKKEAAWKLVEYIASKEGQEILTATGYQIPVYSDLATSPDIINRETANNRSPQNYECFVDSAMHQSYGLWQYRDTQTWKTLGYDTESEKLYAENPSERISVDTFLNNVKNKIGQYL